MDENVLAHHGVIGMKWGVRRYQPYRDGKKGKEVGEAARKAKGKTLLSIGKRTTTKTSAKETPKKRPLSELTDDELRKKVQRLELEKKYRELNAKEISRGRKIVNNVLETAGKDLATQFVKYAVGTSINNVFGEEIIKVGGDKKKKQNGGNNNHS